VLERTFEQFEALRAQQAQQQFTREGREDSLNHMIARSVDLWAETAEPVADVSSLVSASEQLKYMGEYDSIFDQRSNVQSQLRGFDHFDGYRDEEREGGMDAALTLINAEVALARAAFPAEPFYVT
jgi:hypothetical protein